MQEKEVQLRQECEDLQKKLQDPAIYSSKDYPKLAKRQKYLEDILALFDDLHRIEKHTAQTRELVASGGEISELAKEELEELRGQKHTVEQALSEALAPEDPNNDRDVIVEIRAAAGGDEPLFFPGAVFSMCSR